LPTYVVDNLPDSSTPLVPDDDEGENILDPDYGLIVEVRSQPETDLL